MRLVVREYVHQELCDKQIDNDDQNRSGHDRLSCGPADSLCASTGRHTIKTADRGNDETEHHRFYQSHKDVLKHQGLPGVAPVLARVKVQQNLRYEQSTSQTNE